MPNKSVSIRSPQNIQLILQSLFSLLPAFGDDTKILTDLLHQIRLGCCGELDKDSVEEHYGALFIDQDNIQSVRDAIFVESLVKCIDNCALSARRWLMENVVQVLDASLLPFSADPRQDLWLAPSSPNLSPLLSTIHTRKLALFTHGCLSLLNSTASQADVQLVSRLIHSQVMPEVEIVNSIKTEVRSNIVRIILQFLTFHHNEDVVQWAASLVTDWYHQSTEWKKTVEATLKNIVSSLNLLTFIFTFCRLRKTNGVRLSSF